MTTAPLFPASAIKGWLISHLGGEHCFPSKSHIAEHEAEMMMILDKQHFRDTL